MHALTYFLAYPFLYIISKLPFSLFYILSDLLSFFMQHIFKYRKEVIRKNLNLVFPKLSDKEKKIIERKAYKHLCDLFLEIIKSLGISKEDMTKRFVFKNIEVIKEFENDNRSCFIMCGHYSSWEWMLSISYYIDIPGIGIYSPLENPYFDNLVKKMRKKHKALLLSRYDTVESIIKNEKNNYKAVYGFAADQSPKLRKKTYWTKFMGIDTPFFTGAERLSRKLNIPVVFAEIKRVKRGYYEAEFKVLSKNPVKTKEFEITNKFIELVENQIKLDPSEYFWAHNRFKHSKSFKSS